MPLVIEGTVVRTARTSFAHRIVLRMASAALAHARASRGGRATTAPLAAALAASVGASAQAEGSAPSTRMGRIIPQR